MKRRLWVAVPLLATAFLAPPAKAAPTAGSVSAANIEAVGALLQGGLNPEGPETAYWFEYTSGVNFASAASTPVATVEPGVSTVSVSRPITGLAPSSLYRFRLVASNLDATVFGPPSTFTTTAGFGFLPGIDGFSAAVTATRSGAPARQAGSHPYQVALKVKTNLGESLAGDPTTPFPDGDIRDLHLELPAGLTINPTVVTSCSDTAFHTPRTGRGKGSRSGEYCQNRSEVGTVAIRSSIDAGATRSFGLFNLEAPPGVPARIGASPYGMPLVFDQNITRGANGQYTFTLDGTDIPQALDMSFLEVTIWGAPADNSHNGERGDCLNEENPAVSHGTDCKVLEVHILKVKKFGPNGEFLGYREIRVEEEPKAYLALPHKCSGTLPFAARADSWQQPAATSADTVNRVAGQPVEMNSCLGVAFDPHPDAALNDTKASSPSGFNFRYSVDYETLVGLSDPAPSPTKQARVKLPEGSSINPSVGAGLGYCTPSQYAAESTFSRDGENCPLTSKIGTFEVRVVLFEQPFTGSIYLAQPDNSETTTPGAENPFDTLAAVYLIARQRNRGVMIKVPGRIVPDQVTGTPTAIFDELPQLPYTALDLTFRTGQRAFLITPPNCGPARSIINLSPWAGAGSVEEVSNTPITSGIGGGPCPDGTPPFSPGVVAGGRNGNTNSFTPYFVHISRQDTEQELTSYSLDLPEGVTGKLAGVTTCPDTAIEMARRRTGLAETIHPSCPESSRVGHITSGYGVDRTLAYATGGIYLAGPYHGQPLSLVAINPATVGPFDLGTIVIRSAFSVDPHTARLAIDPGSSDRIPHIIDGIPLHLRDVLIYMDRPEFTHSSSSCAPSELVSTTTGAGPLFETAADDSASTARAYYQLLNCRTLGFDPKLGVRILGGTRRRAYPKLRVTYTTRGWEDSNLKEIGVSMPHAEFFAQEHVRGVCTRPQFNAESCPSDSVYGSAVAHTPLFDKPLEGPVYLRSSDGQIPDLVASLHAGAIHVVLEGAIGGTKQGGVHAYFGSMPDEPITSFSMTFFGGKRGLLQNSSDVCAHAPNAVVKALGQNNVGTIFSSELDGPCKSRGRRH